MQTTVLRAPEETPNERASRMGVSHAAIDLLAHSEVIDLHLESSVPNRLWGYSYLERHDDHPLAGHFFGHIDFPRALDGGLTGAMWSIATNPARSAAGRLETTRANIRELVSTIEQTSGALRVVKNRAEYDAARKDGVHAAMVCVQGGNAYEALGDDEPLSEDGELVRVTVVHLSNSCFGATSSPLSLWKSNAGLTSAGRRFVERLNQERIFVDLAHVSRQGFWDAVDVHDKSQPLIVTHTGVDGVHAMWRNIDDKQIRAVAGTGGTIGIIFQTSFLKRRNGPTDSRMVLEHMEHIIKVAGEDFISIGSDYDGMIVPPPDLRDGATAYARLVQMMLDAGWSETRVQKALGDNYLRAFAHLRPS